MFRIQPGALVVGHFRLNLPRNRTFRLFPGDAAFGCIIKAGNRIVLDSDRHAANTSCLFLLRTAKSKHHDEESQVKKIYVGNFSFNMTEPELRSLFEPFGAIEAVTLATDRDTGRSRGFGFVSMPNDTEAENAMAALNGKDSGGRALTVNEARPQAPRSGGFRDGGGRGGNRNTRQRW
jgi:cold-inducible RNA-binding protein